MEAHESFNILDYLASINEIVNDKNEITEECFSNRPGTSQSEAVNSGNSNRNEFNLEELDEILFDQVGILHSSDVSTDDESVNDESKDESGCLTVETEISDALDGYSDITDEDCGIELKDLKDGPKPLKTALSANRKLQKKLSEALEKITNTLKDKEDQMKRLQKVKEDDKIARETFREPLLQTKACFLSPYFAEPGPIGMCPPSNEDTITKRRNNEITAYHYPSKEWSDSEKKSLNQAVSEVALDYVLKPHTRRLDFLKEKKKEQRKNGTLIKYQEIEMNEEIQRIKFTIKQIYKKSTEEIIKEAGENIDWMRISAQFFEGRRSEEDCELMWNNYRSFFVNKKPFSLSEVRKLKELVKTHGKNWDLIAEKLQTGRTAVQCLSTYQRRLNRNIVKKGAFSQEESAKILRVIEEVRIGDVIPWQTVKLYIEGRKSKQIADHYNFRVKEILERSPFTKEEDALILACVEKLGACKWGKIQKYLPHRTFQNLHNRYKWTLKPNHKIGPWSDEDNFKLIEFVKKHGPENLNVLAKRILRPTKILRSHLKTLIVEDEDTKETRFKTPDEVKEMSKSGLNYLPTAHEKRRKYIQESAYETLKSALEKIYYYLKEPITLENLSSISFPALRMLQKELLKRRKKSVRWNINMQWKTSFPNMEPDVDGYRSMSESEDESGENEKVYKDIESNWNNPEIITQNAYIKSKKKELDEDEKKFIKNVLQTQILEEANREPYPHKAKRIIANLDLCSTMEYSLYEVYLLQQMGCNKNIIKEEENDACILNERDYKISLPEVIHHFVHPRVSQDQVLVLPPNCATLDAMNEILSLDGKLRDTANMVDHSVHYLRYLLNLFDIKPKCLHCSQVESDGTSYEDYKNALDMMKSYSIIPTVEMKKSAMVETKLPGLLTKQCLCDELIKSKATVDLLTKRFIALFLWPCFLQETEIRINQKPLLNRNFYYRRRGKRSKKICKSDDEGCPKKKRRKEESEESETETSSDEISCVPSTATVEESEDCPKATQDEMEVICLSDTHEDFFYAEPTNIEL